MAISRDFKSEHPIQAFPAREYQITQFTSLPIIIGESIISFDRCSQQLVSVLNQELVNYRPRRFLSLDPPISPALAFKGAIISTNAHHIEADIYDIRLSFNIFVTTGGITVGVFSGESRSAVTAPPKDPAALFECLRDSIGAGLRHVLHEVATSRDVNTAPWVSKVTAVDNDSLIIAAGRNDGIQSGNVFSIYRRLGNGSSVEQRVAEIQVEQSGPNTSSGRYYGHSPGQARPGDAVHIFYLADDNRGSDMSIKEEGDIQIPTFITGLVRKEDSGFCMDGANFRLDIIDNVSVRLNPTNKEASTCLEHLAGTRHKVAVAGTKVVGPECSYLAVYHAVPATDVFDKLQINR